MIVLKFLVCFVLLVDIQSDPDTVAPPLSLTMSLQSLPLLIDDLSSFCGRNSSLVVGGAGLVRSGQPTDDDDLGDDTLFQWAAGRVRCLLSELPVGGGGRGFVSAT